MSKGRAIRRSSNRVRVATAAAGVMLAGSVAIGSNSITVLAQAQVDIVGPSGSESFGTDVLVLSNGNYVVADPLFDSGTTQNVGAVYLYSGVTNQVITTITGSTTNDQIGEGGTTEVGSSNFVIDSPSWANSGTAHVGAVTWVNGRTGLNGQVSPTNSLVGTTAGDSVGFDGVTVLSNHNYVVDSSLWGAGNLGAVTWANGDTGIVGAVSSTNSLVGASALDAVGLDGITPLNNGNYVVASDEWSNGKGAVTWGNGSVGSHGVVGIANSLVGSTAGDFVGTTSVGSGVTPLTNGNYVVASSSWTNAGLVVGAVTWASGTASTGKAVNT